MLKPDTVLCARYEIISALGAGGMGEVYKARDIRLEREVAIKVLPEHLAKNPQALARFEREAKALAALSHSNILSIYDFGDQDGVAFAVMELLKGETLRMQLAKNRLSWEKATAIGSGIVDGLAAAHSQGVIHRDLKPENIFLTTDGGVKILDFGLARWDKIEPAKNITSSPTESQLTQQGAVMGTVPYMSPEQVRGLPLDARSDLFSFGTMLYEMLAGSRPFSGNSSADLVASILKEEPPTLTRIPGCPDGLSEAVARCLRKNPEERFQTARDLSFTLKMAVSGSVSPPTSPAVSSSAGRIRIMPWRVPAIISALAAIILFSLFFLRHPTKSVNSIAVLPFINSSGDSNTDYLSDGVTESIINALSQIPDLRVMARGTVFTYKGKEVDPRKVGHDLNVETVVTGSILQKADSLMISADLVKVSDGTQLWGERYSRTPADLLTVQSEISHAIVEKLHPRLSAEKQQAVTKNYTENTEAYQFYLRARYHWSKDTPDDYDKASEYFNKAIEKDPNYALAYIGLANYYSTLALHGVSQPKDAWDQYRPLMTKAKQLDPYAVESNAADMDYKWFYEWNFVTSEKSLQRGLELNPGNAELHRLYAVYLRSQGRWDESIAQAKRGLEPDPLSISANKSLATVYFWAKRYDEALDQLKKTVELDPNFDGTHDDLADVYARKGMYKESITETAQYLKLNGDEEGAAELTKQYEKSGYAAAIQSLYEKQLDLLRAHSAEGYVSPMTYVFIYAHLNRKDEAFQWLNESYKERTSWLVFLKTDPQFDNLRSDPRLTDLMKKVGLIR